VIIASDAGLSPPLPELTYRHRLSPEPLTEAIAQRAGEPEFGAALRCLAVCSAYWAGHPEVNA
jgi:hypothetical protein